MIDLVSCVLLALIALILRWYYNYFKHERSLKDLPGPKPVPVLGNALEFRKTTELFSVLMGFCSKYHGPFKIYVASQPYVFIWKPADLKLILNSTSILKKSDSYRFTHSWLGDGLLNSTGKKWAKHRKMITPAFHFQILGKFLGTFNDASAILIGKLNGEVGKPFVDLYPFVTLCTLDVICETAMGTSVHAQDNAHSSYVKSVHGFLEIALKRMFSPFYQNDFIYQFTELCREETRILKILHGFTNSVIRKRKLELSEEKRVDGGWEQKDKVALLDLLLRSIKDGRPLTEKEIREEVDTFTFEGHDTTATAITFCLYSLAQHPHIQEKTYEELWTIFQGDSTRPVTMEDLSKMRYLDLVIKESMRRYPTVPLIARELTEDTEFNGKILPKGLTVNMWLAGTHMNPELHPNPEVFDPDRFLPENVKHKDPFHYVPFSAGPRNCIGQRYAILEVKTIVSSVLRHFELLPVVPEHELILVVSGVLRSSNGVPVRLKRRKKIDEI